MATDEQLDKATGSFDTHHKELKGYPGKANAAFDKAIAALRGAEIGGLVNPITWPVSGGAFYLIEKLQDNKPKVVDALAKLLKDLDAAMQFMQAPFTVINYAGHWLEVKGKIDGARNDDLVDGDLSPYWKGMAADRYASARTVQEAALQTLSGTCDKVHDALICLSDAALTLYTELTKTIVDLMGKVANALANLITDANPGAIVGFIADASNAVANLYSDILNAASKNKQLTDVFTNFANSPYGLPDNKWPSATADRYSAPTLWTPTT